MCATALLRSGNKIKKITKRAAGGSDETHNVRHTTTIHNEQLKKCLSKRSVKAELLQPDTQGRTPLIAAIQKNQPQMVEEILRFYQANNIDINTRDAHGNTALHCACQEPVLDERIITGLLRFPGVDVSAQNLDGNTPLHFFCEKFSNPACQDYIDQFLSMGADVNAANVFGETLLHKAVLNSSVRIILVKALLEHHADVNKVNNNGDSPLHFAVRMSRDDLVVILLKAGADITMRDRREKKTPLELARSPKIIARLKKVQELWDWLAGISPEIYECYRTKFCAEELFLDVMPMAHDKMLENLGVKEIHRTAILAAVAKLAKEREAAAAAAASSPETTPSPKSPAMTPRSEDDATASARSAELQRTLSFTQNMGEGSDKWIIQSREIEFVGRAGNTKERERIGAGTSGKVYRAILRGKDDVAVKILKPWTNDSQVEEFKKEFEIMCALRDPYIVRFYGACLEPKLSLVMEFCERDTLFDVMNNERNDIGWASVLRWAEQYTRAMVFLHGFKPQVLHRDFKSLNILVTHSWECRVCDFGLSRFNTTETVETLKQMRGTFTHMAPELCQTGDEERTDPDKYRYTDKSDVYSMGIVLWEMAKRCADSAYSKPWFSEFPSLGGPGMEVMIILKAQQGIRPSLKVGNPADPQPGTVPPPIDAFYRRAVAQDRADRPNAEQFLAEVLDLRKQYEANKDVWDRFRKPPTVDPKQLVPTIPDAPAEAEKASAAAEPAAATAEKAAAQP